MNYPKITFAVTTCKRIDLFEKMLESFIENCEDLDLITDWVLADDNSSIQDIRRMMVMHPAFELRHGQVRGQAANLNRLIDTIKTEWWFHCEDDFLFTRKGHFIRDMFHVAHDDERIKNVVLRGWKGAYIKHGDLEYYMHIYNRAGDPKMNPVNDWNWFGYSLNPGLQHLPTVKKLGRYNEKIITREFDRPIAERYWSMGYKRANLMEAYIEHEGQGKSVYCKEYKNANKL